MLVLDYRKILKYVKRKKALSYIDKSCPYLKQSMAIWSFINFKINFSRSIYQYSNPKIITTKKIIYSKSCKETMYGNIGNDIYPRIQWVVFSN